MRNIGLLLVVLVVGFSGHALGDDGLSKTIFLYVQLDTPEPSAATTRASRPEFLCSDLLKLATRWQTTRSCQDQGNTYAWTGNIGPATLLRISPI